MEPGQVIVRRYGISGHGAFGGGQQQAVEEEREIEVRILDQELIARRIEMHSQQVELLTDHEREELLQPFIVGFACGRGYWGFKGFRSWRGGGLVVVVVVPGSMPTLGTVGSILFGAYMAGHHRATTGTP